MKKLTFRILLLLITAGSVQFAQAQFVPQPSPWCETSQMVGLAKVTVTYSRPSMKGRTIFGDLVAFDEVWRTGANASTKITFDEPLIINGGKIEAGTYSFYTIPGKTEWSVILNTNTGSWGTGGYDTKNDVLRMKVTTKKVETTESFTIDFSNIGDGTANLNLYWENTMITIPIKNDYSEKALANITAAISEAEGSYGTYEGAAEYYIDNNIDLDKALTWAKKSVDMSAKYWNTYTLSRAYAAKGMYKEAVAMAEQSLALAKAANSNTYTDLNLKNISDWKTKM